MESKVVLNCVAARADLQVPAVHLPVHRVREQVGLRRRGGPREHGAPGGMSAVRRAGDHGEHDPDRDVLWRGRGLVATRHHVLRQDLL